MHGLADYLIMSGFLEKQGSYVAESWKKRYFTLSAGGLLQFYNDSSRKKKVYKINRLLAVLNLTQ